MCCSVKPYCVIYCVHTTQKRTAPCSRSTFGLLGVHRRADELFAISVLHHSPRCRSSSTSCALCTRETSLNPLLSPCPWRGRPYRRATLVAATGAHTFMQMANRKRKTMVHAVACAEIRRSTIGPCGTRLPVVCFVRSFEVSPTLWTTGGGFLLPYTLVVV
jgi:hypothetical protein